MKIIVLTLLLAFTAISYGQTVDMPAPPEKPLKMPDMTVEMKPVKEMPDKVIKAMQPKVEVVKETVAPSDYTWSNGDWTASLIPSILVNAGFAKGSSGEKGDARDGALVLGVGANFLYKKVNNKYFEKINFMSLGFNMNHEADTKFFVSPVNFTFKDNLNAGFAIQGTKEDVKGGKVVLFVGFDF